ncbi:MAG: hypothetical protein BYD32DRAFT_429342 [Podila humilis]|nr:MAG: hypothetical protein BYD32DRAFT_429342 [Podila humilis]
MAMPTYAMVAAPTSDPMSTPLVEPDPPSCLTGSGPPIPNWSPVSGLGSPVVPLDPPDAVVGGWLLSGYDASRYWPKVSALGVYNGPWVSATAAARAW